MSRRFAIALALCVVSASLHAAPRTFVSSGGLDSNPCSRIAPCRSFTAALAFTDADGEVVVIDSAGYGPVSIGQSVTITTPLGVYAGITASGVEGVVITTGADDRVVLKGLTLNGISGAPAGVSFGSAGNLRLEDLSVSGFDSTQIEMFGGGSLAMHHYIVRGNRTLATSSGVFVSGNSAQNALIESSRIEDADVGVFAGPNSNVTVVDSYVQTCTFSALKAQASGIMTVERSVVVNSGQGVNTICLASNPIMGLSNNTIVANGTGVNACAPSVVFSRGNNTIAGNNTDFAGSALTPFSGQ